MNSLYFKLWPSEYYLTINFKTAVTPDKFYNLNFNLHNINLMIYTALNEGHDEVDHVTSLGWFCLDKLEGEKCIGAVLTDFASLVAYFKRTRAEIYKSIKYQKREKEVKLLKCASNYINRISCHDPIFKRTSLKQSQRTINQKLLAHAQPSIVSSIIFPKDVFVKICYGLLKFHPYTGLEYDQIISNWFNSLEWSGGLQLNEPFTTTPLCRSNSAEKVINDWFSDLETATESELTQDFELTITRS